MAPNRAVLTSRPPHPEPMPHYPFYNYRDAAMRLPTTKEHPSLAHAKSYLRPAEQSLPPVYETRPATEADINKLGYHLAQPTADEIEALSRYEPRTFLLKDMNRKRVIVDWANPKCPVAILDVAPVEGWDEATIWIGRTEAATSESNKEAFNRYLRTLLDQLNSQHRQLLHYVAVSNRAQCRWLEQFGFIPFRQLSSYGDKRQEYLVMRRAPANV